LSTLHEKVRGDALATSSATSSLLAPPPRAPLLAYLVALGASASMFVAACTSVLAPLSERGVEAALQIESGVAFVREYDGKYTEDPRLGPAIDRVSKAIPNAVARLHDRLGPDLSALPRSAVCIADGEATALPGHAGTKVFKTDRGDVGVIVLGSESLVSNSIDLEAILVHEFVHVLSEQHLSDAPVWLREGIAIWSALEESVDRDTLLLAHAVRREGDRRVPLLDVLKSESALSAAGHTDQTVAGATVFFELEQLNGTDFVRAVVRRLLAEDGWRAVLENECGKAVPEILAEVRVAFSAWDSTLRPWMEAVSTASSACDRGYYREAILGLDLVLASNPPVAVRPWALRIRWCGQAGSGDLEGAVSAARAFRVEYPHHPERITAMSDEVFFLWRQREWRSVIAVARPLLEDYLWRPGWEGMRESVGGMEEDASAVLRH
jgi:hypothetical protein